MSDEGKGHQRVVISVQKCEVELALNEGLGHAVIANSQDDPKKSPCNEADLVKTSA